MDLAKIKNLQPSKDTITKLKRQATDWKKIFATLIQDKVLVFRVYKELQQPRNKKTIIQFLKNGQKIWTDIIKEDI